MTAAVLGMRVLHLLTALAALVLSWLVVRAGAWLQRLRALAPLPTPALGDWLGGHLAALANPRHVGLGNFASGERWGPVVVGLRVYIPPTPKLTRPCAPCRPQAPPHGDGLGPGAGRALPRPGLVEEPVVVSDPALVHALLKRSGDPDKSRKVYTGLDKLLGGPSLISASTTSPYWRAVRKGIAPAFNMRSLRWGYKGAAGDSGGCSTLHVTSERPSLAAGWSRTD